jgi:hypothetical protein
MYILHSLKFSGTQLCPLESIEYFLKKDLTNKATKYIFFKRKIAHTQEGGDAIPCKSLIMQG